MTQVKAIKVGVGLYIRDAKLKYAMSAPWSILVQKDWSHGDSTKTIGIGPNFFKKERKRKK